jgi:hypothetical protein
LEVLLVEQRVLHKLHSEEHGRCHRPISDNAALVTSLTVRAESGIIAGRAHRESAFDETPITPEVLLTWQEDAQLSRGFDYDSSSSECHRAEEMALRGGANAEFFIHFWEI